jgi:hypothetical protein
MPFDAIRHDRRLWKGDFLRCPVEMHYEAERALVAEGKFSKRRELGGEIGVIITAPFYVLIGVILMEIDAPDPYSVGVAVLLSQ